MVMGHTGLSMPDCEFLLCPHPHRMTMMMVKLPSLQEASVIFSKDLYQAKLLLPVMKRMVHNTMMIMKKQKKKRTQTALLQSRARC